MEGFKEFFYYCEWELNDSQIEIVTDPEKMRYLQRSVQQGKVLAGAYAPTGISSTLTFDNDQAFQQSQTAKPRAQQVPAGQYNSEPYGSMIKLTDAKAGKIYIVDKQALRIAKWNWDLVQQQAKPSMGPMRRAVQGVGKGLKWLGAGGPLSNLPQT
jgi:hypothetical protein